MDYDNLAYKVRAERVFGKDGQRDISCCASMSNSDLGMSQSENEKSSLLFDNPHRKKQDTPWESKGYSTCHTPATL